MYKTTIPGVALLLLAVLTFQPATSWGISLDSVLDKANKALSATDSGSSSSTTGLSTSEIIAGLKEALNKAVDESVDSLGQTGGFLDNAKVRIPLPGSLSKAQQLAEAAGQGELADAFVESMNSAAEKAVPETVDIFTKAIKAMSFEDAKGILEGSDDAATSYFKEHSTNDLTTLIRPLVSQAMETVGVTQRYKALTSGVSSVGALLGKDWLDLDGYVTEKTVAGLFTIMAEEEAKIRENPAERTTELLKKVFGAVN
ncbi:MAG: DUF4197 domain-containing protein [Desulfovibrio sp.]